MARWGEGGGPGLGRAAALALLIVMGAMWGLQFAMLKLAAAGGYSDLAVLAIALVLLSAGFGAIALARRERIRIDGAVLVFLFVTSLLGYVVPLLALLFAASELPAGLLTLFACLSPVVAASLALALGTERVSRARIAAVALGLGSIGMVLVPELELPGAGKAPWMLAALLVPAAYGLESVYVHARWPRGMSALGAVTGEAVMATLLVLPVVLAVGTPLPASAGWTSAETAILVFVAAGIVESLIYFTLVRRTGGVFVNFGAFISLFAGIAWGMALFGEVHSAVTWAAVAALAAALALASR